MASTPRKRIKVKDANSLLIKDLMEEFKQEKIADGRSAATIESYTNSFKRFLSYFGDSLDVSAIDRSLIYQYKGHLQKQREEDGLALESANHYLRDLRGFVNWLYNRNYISEKIDLSLMSGQQQPIETYSDEDVKKLIKTPRKDAPYGEWRTWAIVCFILGTGQRIQTVVNVTVGDIHFGRSDILIRAQKNKKENLIPMDRTLSRTLKIFIDKCRTDATDNEYLFCNVYGEQLTVKALQGALWDYCHAREVEKTSAHALRHTFAKMYIMNGGDVFRLQKILGHSTLEMTRHYVNLFSTDLQKGYDDLSPLNTAAREMGYKERKVKVNK